MLLQFGSNFRSGCSAQDFEPRVESVLPPRNRNLLRDGEEEIVSGNRFWFPAGLRFGDIAKSETDVSTWRCMTHSDVFNSFLTCQQVHVQNRHQSLHVCVKMRDDDLNYMKIHEQVHWEEKGMHNWIFHKAPISFLETQ